ncbi:MAG: pantoate--beta-alanine ligase [Pseudomonadota bacterium]
MQTVHDRETLKNTLGQLRADGSLLALVPTMGALHAGHMTLVEAAKQQADRVAVSIFVNPTQFGPNEDLDAYPRQLAEDSALLKEADVDLLWAPTAEAMYPGGFETVIRVPDISMGLCGGSRPGHFDGVATVVCKLLNQIGPDIALFGEKDYQQLAVIRRMVRDLDMVPQIIGVPTVRDDDGLALSSRNAYLTADERQRATTLPDAIREAIATIEAGCDMAKVLEALTKKLSDAGFDPIDYAEIRHADTLAQLSDEKIDNGPFPARLLVAARLGKTRLIDNWPLTVP